MKQNSNLILLSFIISLVATLGSLFFSEIMQFVPCSMCWYQRIFMYPLVLIFLINLLYPDDKIFKYTFALICVGLLFSIYHNLLMFGIISEDMVPCVQGIPCSTVYINWFGFITIPFLSFIAYFLLFILQIRIYKNSKGN
ncbi:disulfide oxidoreductase [Arcobacter sp. KX21116]|jgi:disulfide bond formation protein DsbB|uniref:disulfide oxidoreductase n=1 Tax=Arcobacter iocasae TaxID=2906515 RepID=UPI0035D52461|tara:strand:- start:24184 stop:24603 length:420 start_codon:yes stop_codon:yes gene_type:complete